MKISVETVKLFCFDQKLYVYKNLQYNFFALSNNDQKGEKISTYERQKNLIG